MEHLNLEAILFYGFAGLALLGAFGVLLSRNIVRTAMWLLATLSAGAGFYFLLGALFVGAIQLVVYAGGTLVLIVFGVMLTNRSLSVRMMPSRVEVLTGVLVAMVLAGGLIAVVLSADWQTGQIVRARQAWRADGYNDRPVIEDLLAVREYLAGHGVAARSEAGRPWDTEQTARLAQVVDFADRRENDPVVAGVLFDEEGNLLPADRLLAVRPRDVGGMKIDVGPDAPHAEAVWALLDESAPAEPIELVAYNLGVESKLTDMDADGTHNLGTGLLSTYLVPFEVVSVLLLAVLVGAAYLARPRRVPAGRKIGGGS